MSTLISKILRAALCFQCAFVLHIYFWKAADEGIALGTYSKLESKLTLRSGHNKRML